MMRILIADDHAVVRTGLKQILAEEFGPVEFLLASTIQETLEAIGQDHLDLVVLDLFMPGGHGLGVLKEVRISHPTLPVLVLTSASEEQLGLRVMQAGASGYVDKQAIPERLVQAAHTLLRGGRYVSATMAELFAAEACRGCHPLHEKLSPREFQILHHVVRGQCLKGIADILHLSVKTVRTYHARLLEKLHLQSDVDLVHYALDRHLVERNIVPSMLPK
jgi:two-component system, NarL family, invasion response regulator UvrY